MENLEILSEKQIEELTTNASSKPPKHAHSYGYPYYELLDARPFEILIYHICKRKIEIGEDTDFDRIDVLSGQKDGGRDCIFHKNNKFVGVIQCKNYKEEFSKSQFINEFLKFTKNVVTEEIPNITCENFKYFICTSKGIHNKTLDFINEFNKTKTIDKELIQKNIETKALSEDEIEKLINVFKLINLEQIRSDDLDLLLNRDDFKDIRLQFFELEKVYVVDKEMNQKIEDIEETTNENNKILKDLKKTVERIFQFEKNNSQKNNTKQTSEKKYKSGKLTEDEIWEKILKEDSVEGIIFGFYFYLGKYPKGEYSQIINEQLNKIIQEEGDWSYVKSSPIAINKFIEKYPNGRFIDKAKKLKIEIEWKTVKEKLNRKEIISFISNYNYPDYEFKQEAQKLLDILNKKDKNDWSIAKKENTIDSYTDYINKYSGEGIYFNEAIEKKKHLEKIIKEDFIKIQELRDINRINNFILFYKSGDYVEKAKKILKHLEEEKKNKISIKIAHQNSLENNKYNSIATIVNKDEGNNISKTGNIRWYIILITIVLFIFFSIGLLKIKSIFNPDFEDIYSNFSPVLKEAVIKTLNKNYSYIPSIYEIEQIDSVNLYGKKITNISGLEYFTNLKRLNISCTQVSDLSPIKDLKRIEELQIANCPLKSISDLSNKTNLKILNCATTYLNEISPLYGLVNIEELYYLNSIDYKQIETIKKTSKKCKCVIQTIEGVEKECNK